MYGPSVRDPTSTTAEKAARFSAGEVARMFDLPEAKLRYWSQTGFITPSARAGDRRFYAFTDLIAVKVAKELLETGQPLQRVRRSLDALRDHVPGDASPLSRLRIRSEDGRIIVDDCEGRFDATTGQLLLDFDLAGLHEQVAEVRALPWVGRDSAQAGDPASRHDYGGEGAANDTAHEGAVEGSAYDAFLHACDLEARWHDTGAELDSNAFHEAVAAYERAIAIDPNFAAAWTNLGGLMAEAGDLDGARDSFDEALRCDPHQPEARCNLAELALRAGEHDLAIEGFRGVLYLDPDHLEAHYGLARALLRVGGRAQARAHLERFCARVAALAPDDRSQALASRAGQAKAVLRSLGRGE